MSVFDFCLLNFDLPLFFRYKFFEIIPKIIIFDFLKSKRYGQIAQSVEQRTENPCVGGSIPSLPTLSGKVKHSRILREA